MGVRKRVSAFLLAVLLSFGVCAVDYLKVDALEVGGSVVWDTAINYLLGLLGLSPIAENGDKIVDFDSMRSKWVQDYEAYFYANVNENDLPEGYTKERAYQNWIDNVCRGNLNTVEYGAWDIFKEWAETLPSESSGGGSGSGSFTLSDLVDSINSIRGTNYAATNNDIVDSINVSFVFFSYLGNNTSWNVPNQYFATDPSASNCLNFDSREGAFRFVIPASTTYPIYQFTSRQFSTYTQYSWSVITSPVTIFTYADRPREFYIYPFNLTADRIFEFPLSVSSAPSVLDYAVVNDRVTDLQIINDYSTTTTQNVVSIDWDKIGSMISDAVGTVTGSLDRTITDALDDAQEKVAAGTMSVSNYNDYVTEISNTYVYDITNETSITNPDSTVTGVVSENVENAEFVLKGLQYVFPFCIPWDIKDFVTLLVADPVAPVIEYPIYNPVTDTDEIITIDFSLWENQVRIIRYIFDFLLIIGLLLLARSLIGAGGSD